MWHVRKATDEDIRSISPRLRQEDVEEIYASTGMSPLNCLEMTKTLPAPESLHGMWVGVKNDIPEIIFGLVHATDELGVPWMMCTDELKRSPKEFVRLCKKWVQGFSRMYPVLRNYVYAKNELHIRWLKWCGFEFTKLHESHGFTKEPFWEFEMKRED
jgi:hypothetical protein